MSSKIDYYEIIKEYNDISGEEFKYASYPSYIIEAMKDSLTVFCLKHDIKEAEEITKLSELVDDVTFNIQTAMIYNKLKEKQSNDRN